MNTLARLEALLVELEDNEDLDVHVWELLQEITFLCRKEKSRPSRLPSGYEVALTCSFTIQGKPGIKQRPRWSNRTKRMMNPAENRLVEEAIRNQVVKQIPEAIKDVLPWHGPVIIDVRFYWTIGKFRGVIHNVRPDLDNAVKSVCDSLNDILWNDDGQVFDFHCRKEYDRTTPRTELKVYFLEQRNGIS